MRTSDQNLVRVRRIGGFPFIPAHNLAGAVHDGVLHVAVRDEERGGVRHAALEGNREWRELAPLPLDHVRNLLSCNQRLFAIGSRAGEPLVVLDVATGNPFSHPIAGRLTKLEATCGGSSPRLTWMRAEEPTLLRTTLLEGGGAPIAIELGRRVAASALCAAGDGILFAQPVVGEPRLEVMKIGAAGDVQRSSLDLPAPATDMSAGDLADGFLLAWFSVGTVWSQKLDDALRPVNEIRSITAPREVVRGVRVITDGARNAALLLQAETPSDEAAMNLEAFIAAYDDDGDIGALTLVENAAQMYDLAEWAGSELIVVHGVTGVETTVFASRKDAR